MCSCINNWVWSNTHSKKRFKNVDKNTFNKTRGYLIDIKSNLANCLLQISEVLKSIFSIVVWVPTTC